MRATLTQCLNCLSIVVLLASTTAVACPRCKPCLSCVDAGADESTKVRVHIDASVDESHTTSAATTGRSILILNCPEQAHVTIDGRATHASGSVRQYRVTHSGNVHHCRIVLRLRNIDEEATYQFSQALEFRNGKRISLTVTRHQMTRTAGK